MDRGGLDQLISGLARRGYRVLGPVVRDGAISLSEVSGANDLPEGWHDTQAPGSYRLAHGDDPALFGWAVGQHSIKGDVFPSRSLVWRAEVSEGDVRLEEARDETPPTALVGTRPCELAALAVLDRVMGHPTRPDPLFRRRRAGFVAVVECGTPSGTCFCTSMDSGPAVEEGFDIALTELLDEDGHRFLVRAGSDEGAAVLGDLTFRAAEERDFAARSAVVDHASSNMGRKLDTRGLAALLERNLEHPRWDEVAERCLACGNCTLVCPTCFCATIEDTTQVDGTIERHRSWSSCFDLAHSYMSGGPVRSTTRSRYKQWMTHKLSTWWDQFGTSGCVGCGRCVTWCPVGIDITEEAEAIRASDGAVRSPEGHAISVPGSATDAGPGTG